MKTALTIFAIIAAWAIGELHGQLRQSRAQNATLETAAEIVAQVGVKDPLPLPKQRAAGLP